MRIEASAISVQTLLWNFFYNYNPIPKMKNHQVKSLITSKLFTPLCDMANKIERNIVQLKIDMRAELFKGVYKNINGKIKI